LIKTSRKQSKEEELHAKKFHCSRKSWVLWSLCFPFPCVVKFSNATIIKRHVKNNKYSALIFHWGWLIKTTKVLTGRLHHPRSGRTHAGSDLFDWLARLLGLDELVQNDLLSQAQSIRSIWTSLWSWATLMQAQKWRHPF
jgi:hypothetical protein